MSFSRGVNDPYPADGKKVHSPQNTLSEKLHKSTRTCGNGLEIRSAISTIFLNLGERGADNSLLNEYEKFNRLKFLSTIISIGSWL